MKVELPATCNRIESNDFHAFRSIRGERTAATANTQHVLRRPAKLPTKLGAGNARMWIKRL